ncbi:hypothetical protein BH23ACT5_BH23ACT5_24030 [soil metagenome]
MGKTAWKGEPMNDQIDLKDKVLAAFDTDEATSAAVEALEAENVPVEVIDDEAGLERLDPDRSSGLLSGLKEAATTVLSDEDQVVDHATDQVGRGRSFVVVDVSETDQAEVAAILRRYGGHYMWHFGQWSYVRLSEE